MWEINKRILCGQKVRGKNFISSKSEWKGKEHRLANRQDFRDHFSNYSIWSELQTTTMTRDIGINYLLTGSVKYIVTRVSKRKYEIRGIAGTYGLYWLYEITIQISIKNPVIVYLLFQTTLVLTHSTVPKQHLGFVFTGIL